MNNKFIHIRILIKIKRLIKSIIPNKLIEKYKEHKLKEKSKHFVGNDVYCPICESEFRMFGPTGLGKKEFGVVGIGARQNAQCFKCGSAERDRLLFKYLTEELHLLEIKENLRLLHFAPDEPFYHLFSKNKYIEYYPCDIDPLIYPFIGNTKIRKVDITSIPFDNNYFDFIICNHVLEHVSDDKLAMSELYRVMKEGGRGYFQVPIDYNRTTTYEDNSITTPKEREIAFGQRDHVRWYGQDYKTRLEEIGFTVHEDSFVKKFSEEELFKYGLDSLELIYSCQK